MVRADSGYYPARRHRRRRPGQGVVLGHRTDEPLSAARDRGDPRAGVDPDPLPAGRLGRRRAAVYLRSAGRRGRRQVTCRLVVRRVERLGKATLAAADAGQDQLFITNSAAADKTHRDHAIIEQVIAELKDGPPVHAPSEAFTANAGWLGLACLAFNLLRAAGAAASVRHARARWATHPAHPTGRRPRPDRVLGPAARAAPTDRLALGARLGRPLGHRHRPLTIQPQRPPGNTPTWKSRTDRPIRNTHTPPERPSLPEIVNSRPGITFGGSGLSGGGLVREVCDRTRGTRRHHHRGYEAPRRWMLDRQVRVDRRPRVGRRRGGLSGRWPRRNLLGAGGQ